MREVAFSCNRRKKYHLDSKLQIQSNVTRFVKNRLEVLSPILPSPRRFANFTESRGSNA
jgi:hypothetical protein